ncbi:hypothetical protein F4780DRAFT_725378 [Xylariomycetidae sp. FL0641]|nr:hypothetical protein F4780DRAFT_725378 [Xylariomycetidae sp. FL0641]
MDTGQKRPRVVVVYGLSGKIHSSKNPENLALDQWYAYATLGLQSHEPAGALSPTSLRRLLSRESSRRIEEDSRTTKKDPEWKSNVSGIVRWTFKIENRDLPQAIDNAAHELNRFLHNMEYPANPLRPGSSEAGGPVFQLYPWDSRFILVGHALGSSVLRRFISQQSSSPIIANITNIIFLDAPWLVTADVPEQYLEYSAWLEEILPWKLNKDDEKNLREKLQAVDMEFNTRTKELNVAKIQAKSPPLLLVSKLLWFALNMKTKMAVIPATSPGPGLHTYTRRPDSTPRRKLRSLAAYHSRPMLQAHMPWKPKRTEHMIKYTEIKDILDGTLDQVLRRFAIYEQRPVTQASIIPVEPDLIRMPPTHIPTSVVRIAEESSIPDPSTTSTSTSRGQEDLGSDREPERTIRQSPQKDVLTLRTPKRLLDREVKQQGYHGQPNLEKLHSQLTSGKDFSEAIEALEEFLLLEEPRPGGDEELQVSLAILDRITATEYLVLGYIQLGCLMKSEQKLRNAQDLLDKLRTPSTGAMRVAAQEAEYLLLQTKCKLELQRGQYPKALETANESFRGMMRLHGARHLSTFKAKKLVAKLLVLNCSGDKAVIVCEDLLQTLKACGRNEDPENLDVLQSWVVTLRYESWFSTAINIGRHIYGIMKTSPSTDPATILDTRAELAACYSAEGNYAQAEAELRDVIWRSGCRAGWYHSVTLQYIGDLANIYCLSGEHLKSRTLALAVLQDQWSIYRKKDLLQEQELAEHRWKGPRPSKIMPRGACPYEGHDFVTGILVDILFEVFLSEVLRSLNGLSDEDVPRLSRTYSHADIFPPKGLEAKAIPRHLLLLDRMNDRNFSIRIHNEEGGKGALNRLVSRIQDRSALTVHPWLVRTLKTIAFTYIHSKSPRVHLAVEILVVALIWETTVFGSSNRQTLDTAYDLAIAERDSSILSETIYAEESLVSRKERLRGWLRTVYSERLSRLGRLHPDTARSRKELLITCGAYKALPEFAEADKPSSVQHLGTSSGGQPNIPDVINDILICQTEMLGEEHPDTIETLQCIFSLLLQHEDEIPEARRAANEILKRLRSEASKAQRPRLALQMERKVALTYQDAGYPEEANEIFQALDSGATLPPTPTPRSDLEDPIAELCRELEAECNTTGVKQASEGRDMRVS